jgi:hypothetical protein
MNLNTDGPSIDKPLLFRCFSPRIGCSQRNQSAPRTRRTSRILFLPAIPTMVIRCDGKTAFHRGSNAHILDSRICPRLPPIPRVLRSRPCLSHQLHHITSAGFMDSPADSPDPRVSVANAMYFADCPLAQLSMSPLRKVVRPRMSNVGLSTHNGTHTPRRGRMLSKSPK